MHGSHFYILLETKYYNYGEKRLVSCCLCIVSARERSLGALCMLHRFTGRPHQFNHHGLDDLNCLRGLRYTLQTLIGSGPVSSSESCLGRTCTGGISCSITVYARLKLQGHSSPKLNNDQYLWVVNQQCHEYNKLRRSDIFCSSTSYTVLHTLYAADLPSVRTQYIQRHC